MTSHINNKASHVLLWWVSVQLEYRDCWLSFLISKQSPDLTRKAALSLYTCPWTCRYPLLWGGGLSSCSEREKKQDFSVLYCLHYSCCNGGALCSTLQSPPTAYEATCQLLDLWQTWRVHMMHYSQLEIRKELSKAQRPSLEWQQIGMLNQSHFFTCSSPLLHLPDSFRITIALGSHQAKYIKERGVGTFVCVPKKIKQEDYLRECGGITLDIFKGSGTERTPE